MTDSNARGCVTPEVINQWYHEWNSSPDAKVDSHTYVALKAFKQGALDAILEAASMQPTEIPLKYSSFESQSVKDYEIYRDGRIYQSQLVKSELINFASEIKSFCIEDSKLEWRCIDLDE